MMHDATAPSGSRYVAAPAVRLLLPAGRAVREGHVAGSNPVSPTMFSTADARLAATLSSACMGKQDVESVHVDNGIWGPACNAVLQAALAGGLRTPRLSLSGVLWREEDVVALSGLILPSCGLTSLSVPNSKVGLSGLRAITGCARSWPVL